MTKTDTFVRPDALPSLDAVAVEEQLSRIVASEGFSHSPRLRQLLTYLVAETLAGRSDRIKGVTIAQDVFGRTDPEVAQTSTIVSIQARRLRRQLSDYYLGAGAGDPIVVEVPKGAFVPVFKAVGQDRIPETSKTTATGIQLPAVSAPSRPAALLLSLLLLLGGFLAWQTIIRLPNSPPLEAVLARPAIAVMPFRNSTGSSLNNRLVSGLTEDIVTDLAGLREIDVISYSSVSLLGDPAMPPGEIAERLRVSHILEGSVRGTAPDLRVNAELLEANTGKVVWASRFDHNLDDPLTMQDAIARKVIEGMSVRLGETERAARSGASSANPEAAALFDQAMGLANPPSDVSRLKIAELAFDAVITADPAYAGGYAGVAYIGAFKALWGHVPDPAAQAEASAAMAKKALELDPTSSLAYDALALSHVVLRDFDQAVRNSARALQVAPNDPYAHSYHAFILATDGRAADGVPFAKRALRLNPLEPRTPYLNILGVVQLHAGDYEGALQSFLQSENRGGPQSAGQKANIAASHAALGNRQEAARIASMLPEGFVDGPWLAWQQRSFRRSQDAQKIPGLLRGLN